MYILGYANALFDQIAFDYIIICLSDVWFLRNSRHKEKKNCWGEDSDKQKTLTPHGWKSLLIKLLSGLTRIFMLHPKKWEEKNKNKREEIQFQC